MYNAFLPKGLKHFRLVRLSVLYLDLFGLRLVWTKTFNQKPPNAKSLCCMKSVVACRTGQPRQNFALMHLCFFQYLSRFLRSGGLRSFPEASDFVHALSEQVMSATLCPGFLSRSLILLTQTPIDKIEETWTVIEDIGIQFAEQG